ncbi:nucleotidyl transferase AbiEii/AbiGii toxin family protein [Gandjariella thermophila]|uniref:Nucleotidyl transferase AbiEii/AbiGii toxin family protein n=1 Tax=Gandjariella thermophila TaxID=1931992 RepID=A0A4D4J421_9PSEU|nr:nucleotidyl transferase AbiEii/AbiGii toxin family protein [Gandjariella thermophila]GDY30214.1 hypothetical protein GTS_18470 [Gandjariella thermophila]
MSMRYRSPTALRAAIESRLNQQSVETGRDLQWLRRRLVFTRILARLSANAPDACVLKGGMAVELRRPGQARATRDVDLVLQDGAVADPENPEEVREFLLEALLDDVDGEWFVFGVRPGTRLRDDAYGRPAWRFTIESQLAGKRFTEQRLDIVARPEEIDGVERRLLPDLLGFAGIPPREVLVTDLRQQFAEKLHALTRTYISGTSTRVKDLADLVILIEDGVPADRELCQAVRHVFKIRGTHTVPRELASPPTAWEKPFAHNAAEIGRTGLSVADAHALVATHWRHALANELEEDGIGSS